MPLFPDFLHQVRRGKRPGDSAADGNQVVDGKQVRIARIVGEIVHHHTAAAIHINTADKLPDHAHHQRAVADDEMQEVPGRQLGALRRRNNLAGIPVQQDGEEQPRNRKHDGRSEICVGLRHARPSSAD